MTIEGSEDNSDTYESKNKLFSSLYFISYIISRKITKFCNQNSSSNNKMDVVYTWHMHLDRSGYSKNNDDKKYESKNTIFHLWNLYYIADVVIRPYK